MPEFVCVCVYSSSPLEILVVEVKACQNYIPAPLISKLINLIVRLYIIFPGKFFSFFTCFSLLFFPPDGREKHTQ